MLADHLLEINPDATIDLVLTGVTEDNARRLTEEVTHVLCEPATMDESAIRWLDDAASHSAIPVVVGHSGGIVSSVTTCFPDGPGLAQTVSALGLMAADARLAPSSAAVMTITGARMALELAGLMTGESPSAIAPECSRVTLYDRSIGVGGGP
jgi:molybdopterin/thiamine biosynthesis adenylyltransferase